HSASASVGFATPGYENSQFVDVSAVEGKIHLQRNTFSPDADGYEDLLIISYDLNTNGTVLNGYVYDLAGRLIYQPVNNKTLSSSGFVSWDGIIENGTKIPVGNYIILLEAFNLDGKTSRKKLAFSVLGNF
ncbi:MAG: gliding motility-associated C-terminal domain-containing protein, partial [Bacteroidia bacterium]